MDRKYACGEVFRRGMILFAVFLAFSFSLAGCVQKEKKKETRFLRLYTWKPNQPEVWNQVIKRFEEEHPGVTVMREIGPHSSTAFHDLLAQKLKNRSRDLDVFLMDVIWPAEFAAAGWAMPLDDLFTEAARSDYLPGTIKANTYQKKIYGVPLFIDSGMLYYRKDLLERYGFEPPVTWEEMVEQSRVITAKERAIYGYSAQFKQYEGLVCNMLEYVMSNGGRLLDPSGRKPAIEDRQAIAAVRFVRDKIIGKCAPAGVLTYEEPESLALFIQGKAVFHRNWPYAWEIANNADSSQVAGKVGIATLPHFAGGKSHAALGGWQVGISAFSENHDLAWTFVQFLTSARIQKILAVRAGLAPTRINLYEDDNILAANPQFRDMKKVFLNASPRPVSPLYPALSNILQRYFSKAISDPRSDLSTEAARASAEMEETLSLLPQP